MRWARRDKESAKSRNGNPVKKGSRSTTQQIPALAHRSPGKAGRNDDVGKLGMTFLGIGFGWI